MPGPLILISAANVVLDPSGYHGEDKELGGGGEKTHQILPRLERQRGTVQVCIELYQNKSGGYVMFVNTLLLAFKQDLIPYKNSRFFIRFIPYLFCIVFFMKIFIYLFI